MSADRIDPEPGAVGGPAQQLVASFATYGQAQHLVDRMSDEGFPVEHVRIIGDRVHTVEQVTGRLTNARAAAAGAGSGAWIGLLIGALLGIFALGPFWLWVLLVCTAAGAVWGAVFGFVAHLSTRGRRDFSSVQGLQAERYDVYVDASHAAQAQQFHTAAS